MCIFSSADTVCSCWNSSCTAPDAYSCGPRSVSRLPLWADITRVMFLPGAAAHCVICSVPYASTYATRVSSERFFLWLLPHAEHSILSDWRQGWASAHFQQFQPRCGTSTFSVGITFVTVATLFSRLLLLVVKSSSADDRSGVYNSGALRILLPCLILIGDMHGLESGSDDVLFIQFRASPVSSASSACSAVI